MAWRHVRVTFIQKPGKYDYIQAKVYRPISLVTFIFKTMEKLMDRHIRDGLLKSILYAETNMLTKLLSPPKLHFIMW
jgi:hypothetical protein